MKQIVITINPDKIALVAIIVAIFGLSIGGCILTLGSVRQQSSVSAETSMMQKTVNIREPLKEQMQGIDSVKYMDGDSENEYQKFAEEEVVETEVARIDSEPQSKSTETKLPSKAATMDNSSNSITSSQPTQQTANKSQANSTTKQEPWPEHVDADGNCLPAAQQVDTNGNFHPTCSSPIEGVSAGVDDSVIYTIGDYEKSILGTCPSQRVSSSWETGSRLPAIGIINSGPNATSGFGTLKNHIESWWDGYKQGRWGTSKKYLMATLGQLPEFDNTYANSRAGMFIDFNGLFVTWDNTWEDGKSINVSEEQRQVLNKMASDGTNYLRWLDSTYKAKCPND